MTHYPARQLLLFLATLAQGLISPHVLDPFPEASPWRIPVFSEWNVAAASQSLKRAACMARKYFRFFTGARRKSSPDRLLVGTKGRDL